MRAFSNISSATIIAALLIVSGCSTQAEHPQPLTDSSLQHNQKQAMLESSSADNSTESPSQAYIRLGRAYLAKANFGRAESALNHAYKLQPDSAQVLASLALLYHQQGKTQQAEIFYRSALERFSRQAFSNAGLYDKTLSLSETATRNNYAAFLYQQGHIIQACKQLKTAIKDINYSKRSQLYENLEQCQQMLNNR